jgi:hypothetical protein
MKPGEERIYNPAFDEKLGVVLWDVFPIIDSEKLTVTFESKHSDWSQGIWLMSDRGLEVEGIRNKSFVLWYETAPKHIEVICFTKNGLLSIYNIWDRGFGENSLSHSSGMLVEELTNGRRFRCNDIGFETKFDKLIFRIERTPVRIENE